MHMPIPADDKVSGGVLGGDMKPFVPKLIQEKNKESNEKEGEKEIKPATD